MGTPLFALCRSYGHANYRAMVEAGLAAATASQGDGQQLHLDDHVDAKGNTLLHILSIHSTIIAMLLSLSRPTSLISSINSSRKAIERNYNSLSRSTRWPLGLLDETRQRLNEEKEDKMRRTKEEADELGRELRYTQQVVAGELAGWQDLHEKMGRKAIRDLAKGMLIKERTTLECMKRAMRKLKITPAVGSATPSIMSADVEVNGSSSAGPSGSL